MTITTEQNSVTYQGNGTATEWPFTFFVPDADNLYVGTLNVATDVLTEIDPANYTITGVGDPAGGEVVYPIGGAPLNAGTNIVIWREVPVIQETELTNQAPYYADILEDQLDKIVMMVQQLQEEVGRSLLAERGSTVSVETYLNTIVADAQAARDLAAGYANDIVAEKEVPFTSTKVGMEALTFLPGQLVMTTFGYTSIGDGGGTTYKRVDSQPSHVGRVRSLDRYLPNGTVSSTNGGWWKIRGNTWHPMMYGQTLSATRNVNVPADFATPLEAWAWL